MWSSLLTSKDSLLKGALWQINSGRNVKVWHDAWIPGIEGHRLQLEDRSGVHLEMVVEDLINWDRGCWDLAGLMNSTIEAERSAIQQIYLPMVRGPDKLI